MSIDSSPISLICTKEATHFFKGYNTRFKLVSIPRLFCSSQPSVCMCKRFIVLTFVSQSVSQSVSQPVIHSTVPFAFSALLLDF